MAQPQLVAEEASLREGRLGVVGIVFFVVAAAAPLVGMTGAVPVAIAAGNGTAVPGTFVIAGITLVLFSVGYSAMSHRITNAGAFYAYVGRGLGLVPGVGCAFVSVVAYLAIQLGIYGFFGAMVSKQMNDAIGLDLSWWVWSILAGAAVLVLSCLAVDVGAKVLGVLLLLEISSLLIMMIAVFVDGGPEGISLGASFSPQHVLAGGLAGSAGIALAFAFASFIGFEATAIYGEESRDPKRTVPRATYAAVLFITLLLTLASWAVVTGLGPSQAVDRTLGLSDGLANPAEVLFSVADTYVGNWLGDLMSWLVLSSLFAGLLAFQNSAARYFFAMGRAGVLPRGLDRVNSAGAPAVASAAASLIGLVVIAYFVMSGKDPVLNLFYWTTGMAVLSIVMVEVLVCVAVIAFFRREGGATVWQGVLAPVLALVGLLTGFYLLMSRFGLLAGTVRDDVDPTTQAWGYNPIGWALVLTPWVVLGVGLAIGALVKKDETEDAIRDLVH